MVNERKPNYHIAASIARATGEKGDYIKKRGIDDEYCQKKHKIKNSLQTLRRQEIIEPDGKIWKMSKKNN